MVIFWALTDGKDWYTVLKWPKCVFLGFLEKWELRNGIKPAMLSWLLMVQLLSLLPKLKVIISRL